ncbi:MAG TPA: hypothetical protein VNO34_04190 [Actinomycetota bacterium]|nr:hypothetical protein [Actinomycetota bacterium]
MALAVGGTVAARALSGSPQGLPQEFPPGALPSEKQAILEEEWERIELSRRAAAQVPADPKAAAPTTRPSWSTGIFPDEAGDFPGPEFSFTTLWRGVGEGSFWAVYAGLRVVGPPEEEGKGMVLVIRIDSETWGHEFRRYVAPIPGPVRIVAADGFQLTLASDLDGSRAGFDVVTGTFSSA